MNAFSYIAALHAENFFILSKPILADVLGCSRKELKKYIIGPLGDEAAATSVSQFVITRHRAIAETAKEILNQEFRIEFDEIYFELLESARRVLRSGTYVPELKEWHHLPRYFYKNGAEELGIRLTQLLHKDDSRDPFFVNQLAGMLRESGMPEQSVSLYRKFPEMVHERRSFFFEWSTSEKAVGNYGNAAWLAGIALADGTATNPLNAERAIYCLNALAGDFVELFDKYNDPFLIEASGAAVQLGLMLPVNSKTAEGERLLRINQRKSKQAGVHDVDPPSTLGRLRKSIIIARQKSETPLPEWIKDPGDLTFNGLARLLHIEE